MCGDGSIIQLFPNVYRKHSLENLQACHQGRGTLREFYYIFNVYAVDSQTELYLLGGTTPSSSGTTINATFVDTQETNKKSLTQEEEIMPAIIIGALLVIPIIIIIVIVIVIRIYKKGGPLI